MSNSEILTLYTTPGKYGNMYDLPTYRQVVALEYQSRLHSMPGLHRLVPTAERFTLPSERPANIANYFAEHYQNNTGAFRNCHLGAAAMTNADVILDDWNLSQAARNLVLNGRRTDDLRAGEWGVIGEVITDFTPVTPEGDEEENDGEYDDEFGSDGSAEDLIFGGGPTPHHSIVGLGEGLCIQTDSKNGPLSIATIEETLRLYQEQIGRVNARLYH